MAVFVELEVDTDEVDLASGLAWGAGAVGVEERPSAAGECRLGPLVRLVVAVGPDGPGPIVGVLGSRWSVEVTSIDDDVADGLLDAWREHARPWRAGRSLVVEPPWAPLPADEQQPGDVVLRIDPGRAFGSGSHVSTRLALGLLESRVPAGARVLDVGSGSGVLGIAALRLGAGSVVAVDIDPAAVEATVANAHANGVGDRLVVTDGPLDDEPGGFDVVVANILAPVLVELAPAMAGAVVPGGAVVLAGFLDDQRDAVVGAFPAGLAVEAEADDEGWGAVVLRRSPG